MNCYEFSINFCIFAALNYKRSKIMEQNKSFNEHPHPCVGVMYPAFLNDVDPATGRDLPPDGMTLEEIESMVVLRT